MIYKNKKIKIIFFISMIIFITATLFINYTNVQAYSVSTKKTGIENFPDSYKPYLNALKEKHPNWTFVAVYTHLDFDYVVENEMVPNRSLVPISYPSSWKLNDTQVEYGWVNASESAVSYSLDPRNFLTEEKIFQFEVTTYNSNEHTIEAVTNILKGTPMGESYGGVDYTRKYKKNGTLVDMDKSYAEIIVEAGKKYNVSPVHLASRIIQENGGDILNNKCLYGSYSGYEGYYNFMNIGATPTGAGAVVNALNYAKNNGWDTPEKAICGAAEKIYKQYIYYGQNTVYFEKFDVNFVETSLYLFGSQYMTNIIAPSSESSIMYKAYNNTNKMDSNFEFHIPVYDNMPNSTITVVDGEYSDDNTLVYLDDTSDSGVTDVFNVRSSPYSNSSSNIIAVIREEKEGQENRTIMTRVKKGNNTGWDKIKLPDGREGYVASQYVKEYIYTKVNSVMLNETEKTLNIGNTFELFATISPNDAKDKSVVWASSNSDVASVDSNGKVTAKSVGETTITVTTKDQSKSAKCVINVVANVESISLEKSSYTIIKDNYMIINPIILPENAVNKEYTIKSLDENIVKVEDLKLKGINVGETTVIFTTKDSNKSVEAKIKVIDISKLDSLSFDESLNVQNNQVTKVSPETKVSDFINKITYNEEKYSLLIKNSNDEVLSNNALVGTATTINLVKKETNDIIQTYTIIIYGDVNGDGKITSMDYTLIKNHIMEIKQISNSFFKESADVSADQKITSMDYTLIKNHIMEIKQIVIR